jgi:hypothetical protein
MVRAALRVARAASYGIDRRIAGLLAIAETSDAT